LLKRVHVRLSEFLTEPTGPFA